MARNIVRTTEAPPSPATYSQAVKAAGLVFVSGTGPVDPTTGKIKGETIQEQTRQCLANISAILEAAGSSLEKVASATVILFNEEDFAGMNEEWVKWFPVDPPARQGAKLPVRVPGMRISIAAIAEAEPTPSSSAVCSVCGKVHPMAESELFFQRPDAIWEMPAKERAKRCKESDDLCVLWGKGSQRDRHFVRAVLPLPVEGRERPYRIGVWVETTKKDFRRILDLWTETNQGQEPPFRAKLANNLPSDAATLGLKVELQLAGPTERPAAFVAVETHPLYGEQTRGITAHRTHEYTHRQ